MIFNLTKKLILFSSNLQIVPEQTEEEAKTKAEREKAARLGMYKKHVPLKSSTSLHQILADFVWDRQITPI